MNEVAKMSLRDTIQPKSDQLNYDDLSAGPETVTVTNLKMGSVEQPVIIEIKNALTGVEMRPYKPCKSMRRVLIMAWGDKGKEWVGKSMTLYGDAEVKWAGVSMGGIRISHVSHIEKPMTIKMTVSRGKRADYIVKPIAE